MEVNAISTSGKAADAFRMHKLLNYRQDQIAAEQSRGSVDKYRAAALQLASANIRYNHADAHTAARH